MQVLETLFPGFCRGSYSVQGWFHKITNMCANANEGMCVMLKLEDEGYRI